MTFLCFTVPCGYLMRRRSERLRAERDAATTVGGGEEGRHPLERGEGRRAREEEGEPLPLYAIDDPWKAELRAGEEPPPPLEDDIGEGPEPPENESVGAPAGTDAVAMTAYPAPSILNSSATTTRTIAIPNAPPPAYTG